MQNKEGSPMTEGTYETLIRTALEEAGPAPWNVRDLDRVKGSLSQEFCSALGADCDKDAVLDWLSALPPDGVADLLDRLNTVRGEDR
jgi:hypothetical protein